MYTNNCAKCGQKMDTKVMHPMCGQASLNPAQCPYGLPVNMPTLAASQNIAHTEGKEIAEITDEDAIIVAKMCIVSEWKIKEPEIIRHKGGVNIITGNFDFWIMFNDYRVNASFYHSGIDYYISTGKQIQSTDYLRSRGYRIPNQYPLPNAIDWAALKERFMEEKGLCEDIRIDQSFAYLKQHFNSEAHMGEGESKWLDIDKGQEPTLYQDCSFIVISGSDRLNGRVLGGRYQGSYEFSTPGQGYSAKLWQPLPNSPITRK